MKILNETELMANQKASTVIVPDKQFEAVQTIEGNSLLFSIDLEQILYCTREVPGDTHGWVRVDLSSALSASVYNGATVAAKTFDIAQDLSTTNSVDIALVVTVNGVDYLHLATGFANTMDNWTSNTPSFTQYPFDDYAHNYAGLPINDVQIMDSNDDNGLQYIIADIITNNDTQTISRYYIDTSFSLYKNPNAETNPKLNPYCAWVPHNLSSDLEAGKITSFLGCGPDDGPNGAGNNIGGVYVLGTVDNEAQLMYAPAFNFYNPEMQQHPTIFNLPAGTDASHMAMALSAPAGIAPYTDMFFASSYKDDQGQVQGGLYFLANADQTDTDTANATPQLIYTHDLFQNIQSIHVENWYDNIVLWGQSLSTDGSGTSQLFIMEGVAGHETDGVAPGVNATSWSCPVPLLFNVVNSSTYVNNNYSSDNALDAANGNAYGSCNILFAQQVIKDDSGNLIPTLTQLFQDPVTSAWQERSLLTEPSDKNVITEMYASTTYSSHIEIADDNNVAVPALPVYAWASSPSNVYITDANNTAAYLTLDPQKPLPLTSDPAGHVTIMQPVDTIGGISYYIAVQDPATLHWYPQVINPLAGTISKLNTNVPDGTNNHLSGVQVTDEWGTTSNLISSSSVTSDQATTQSNNIYQMCQQNTNVNQYGLVTGQSWPDPATAVAALSAVKPVATVTVKQVAPPRSRKVKHAIPSPAKNRVKKFAKPDRLARHIRFNPEKDTIWGCTFGENARHYHGIDAVKEMGVVINADGSLSLTLSNGELGNIFKTIEAKAGHLYKWMKTQAQKLEKMVVSITNGIIDCLLTIAGDVYHFVVKCANDIANAAHTFLNAVETAFADVVKWLGTIFAWMDILRTHSAFKSLFTNYMNWCISNIGTLQTDIDSLFQTVEKDINTWAGLPTDSYSSQQANNNEGNGRKNPSSHWANHHISNNASKASVADDAEEAVLDDLVNAVNNEYGIITDAVAELQSVLNNVQSMPVADVVKEVVGIMANTVLQSANNLIDATIEVSEVMLEGVTDLITAPLHIPILSNLYSTFTDGSQLSYLDLACLAAAVPTTIIYKIANNGDAPFPKGDATSDALISATSLEAIADLCYPTVQVSAAATGGLEYYPNDLKGSLYDKINFCCNLAACLGGIGVSLIGFIKTKVCQQPNPSQKLVSVLSKMYAACYMPYIAPDIGGAIQYIKNFSKGWYDDLSALLGIFGFAKTLVDLKWSTATAQSSPVPPPGKNTFTLPFGKMEDGTWKKFGWYEISPLLETVINLVWEVPVVFQYENSDKLTNDIISLTANTCFNVSGVISPFVSWTTATVQLVFAGIGAVLNIGYGVLSGFWALDNYSNN